MDKLKLILGYYTMNGGEDIAGSVLKHAVEKHINDFDEILILDGRMTPEAQAYYDTLPDKVRIKDSPWRDSHLLQYKARMSMVEEGAWLLMPDDDEMPSQELMEFIDYDLRKDTRGIGSKMNIIGVPSIVYITEDWKDRKKTYYPADPHPTQRGKSYFCRNMLAKQGPSLIYHHVNNFHCETMVPPEQANTIGRITAPMLHLKSAYTYIANDCVNSFVSPENERFPPDQAARFRRILKDDGIDSMQKLRDVTIAGTWSDEMKSFAVDNRNRSDMPISRFFYWYYMIHHPASDTDIQYEDMLKTVLGPWYDYYHKSKKNNDFLEIETTPMI
jgi:hypothetical protein